jgi:DNA polymerase-3 subunit gamma/tau
MLTTEAWNAFLKTLEEPPPHVLFVLATTEPHKVPDTVRSRVQRFDFRRVDRAAIARHLDRIATAEGAAVEEAALDLVARAGQGSVRDALSLLDQALASGERPVTVVTVRRALGLADPAVVRSLLTSLAAADPAGALRAVAAAFDAGADARQLLREAARLARAAELLAIGYAEGAELGEDDEAVCRELATVARPGLWVDALDRFAEAEANLRQPVDARLTVELCILRLTHAAPNGGDLAERVAALEAALRQGGTLTAEKTRKEGARRADLASAPAETPAAAAPPQPPAAAAATPPAPPAAPTPVPTPQALPAQPTPEPLPVRHVVSDPPAPTTPMGAAPTDPQEWTSRWPALIEVVNRKDRMLAGVLRDCRAVESSPGRLVVGAPFGFHEEQLRNRLAKLVEAVTEFAGAPTTVDIRFVGADKQPDAEPTPAPPGASTPEQSTPTGPPPDTTQAVLATFPGSRITGSRLRDHAHE